MDLSKTFNMGRHDKLLKDLKGTTLPPAVKRWLNCFLGGCQSKVQFRGQTSKSRNVCTGVPQGVVTSILLFSFYMGKIPNPPSSIKIVQYADDIEVFASVTNLIKLTSILNVYLVKLLYYLSDRELALSRRIQ